MSTFAAVYFFVTTVIFAWLAWANLREWKRSLDGWRASNKLLRDQQELVKRAIRQGKVFESVAHELADELRRREAA